MESWIDDKLYLANSDDFGQSRDGAELLLRSHETLQLDVHGFESKIEEMESLSQGMIQNDHFERVSITEHQVLQNRSLLQSIQPGSIH